jgi:antitoxin (DNA-binding transcriptional repressor) of toxin-antitoxin stability system
MTTTVTATDLARRTNEVLDTVLRGETVAITRNNTVLGIITPPEPEMTIEQAVALLPKLTPEQGRRWLDDIRNNPLDGEVYDK